MKMTTIFSLIITLLLKSHYSEQANGVVRVHVYFFDENGSSTLDITYKILFKNKISIQEVPLLRSIRDSSGEKIWVEIKHYSYLDPDKNVCYEYKNFSDTAKVMKYYSDIDSVSVGGGWNFQSSKKFEYDSSINLKDTVIGDIQYSRIRLDKKINGDNVYFYLYYRCDKKGILVNLFKPLSDSIGCPIVRDDTFVKNKLFMTRELEFISDSLSLNEIKIFDVWSKNERNK